METIKNYLESMFANLPDTPEVKKAKEELWQMMEDKYNELTADGASDNAAVGTVISEFGNLDEVAEELGIDSVVEAYEKDERKDISLDDAKEFLSGSRKQARQIAVGVALCILSMVGPILCDAIELEGTNDRQVWTSGLADGIGTSLMFILIAAGVVLFIYSSTIMKRWEFIEKEACRMSLATTDYVKEEEATFTPKYALMLSVGVALCIISFVPVVFLDEFDDVFGRNVDVGDIGGAFMFILVAFGVFFIVYSSNVKGSFDKLFKAASRRYLKRKDSGNAAIQDNVHSDGNEDKDFTGDRIYSANSNSGSGNVYTYSEDELNGKKFISPSAEFVMDVFWPTIICIYLSWSFLTFQWYITWIIWPIAAVLDSVLKSMLMKRA